MFNLTRKIQLLAITFTSCLFSGFCHANGWTGYGTFAVFQCLSDNDVAVARCAVGEFTGAANDTIINYCAKPWGSLYLPAESAQNARQVYATILMAYSAGKQVRFYTNGCFEGYPLIGGVSVKN